MARFLDTVLFFFCYMSQNQDYFQAKNLDLQFKEENSTRENSTTAISEVNGRTFTWPMLHHLEHFKIYHFIVLFAPSKL